MTTEVSREYGAFFVATFNSVTYYWGTTDAYRSSQWHSGIMVRFPEPQDSMPDEYGIQRQDRIEIEISDTADTFAAIDPYLPGETGVLTLVTTHHYADGSSAETTSVRTVTVTGYARSPGTLILKLADIEDAKLDQLYPPYLYTVDDWPELFEENVGQAVNVPLGTAIKCQCALVDTNSGAGPWKFAVCQKLSGTTNTILTVYRDGRIVDSGEYSVSDVAAGGGGYTVRMLTFTAEQVDFQGRHMQIEADVSNATTSRTAAVEIQRLLEFAGCATDSSSFTAAAAVCSTEYAFLDIAYGRDGQRKIGAIIGDLLLIARSGLRRTNTGTYAIAQDTTGSSVASYVEDAGDLVEVQDYGLEDLPSTVELAYKISALDPSKTRHTITRDVGGGGAILHYDAPYLVNHLGADRLLSYLTKRQQYGHTATAALHGVQHVLGDVITISGATTYSGSKTWRCRSIARQADSNVASLQLYDVAVYTYSASPDYPPADAVTGYKPDYSKTPPDAPTSVSILVNTAAVEDDGKVTAYIVATGTAPSVNFQKMMYAAINSTTNEQYIQEGFLYSAGGVWHGKIAGLRPNTAHTLVVWCENEYGVKGAASTPIGFTSGTNSAVPGTLASCTAAQGLGKFIAVSWAAASAADQKKLNYYDVKRKVGGAGYADWYQGKSVLVNDDSISYGTSYQYAVRQVDKSGNESAAFVFSSSVTPAKNINGGNDVVDGSVDTTTIASGAVTQSVSTSAGAISISASPTWTTVVSRSITGVLSGSSIQVNFSSFVQMLLNPSATGGYIQGTIIRDSTTLVGAVRVAYFSMATPPSGTSASGSTWSGTLIDPAPGAGNHTYYIKLLYVGTFSTTPATTISLLQLTELKR